MIDELAQGGRDEPEHLGEIAREPQLEAERGTLEDPPEPPRTTASQRLRRPRRAHGDRRDAARRRRRSDFCSSTATASSGRWRRSRCRSATRTSSASRPREKGVPADLIAAVIYDESRFRDQTSHAGARGLMQITPATAEQIERLSGGQTFKFEDLSNPDINIRYGTFYLRYLIDKFGDNVIAALAAYNARGDQRGRLGRLRA